MWFAFSVLLVGAAVASIAIFGLKPSIDFTGGTQMEISYAGEKPSISEFTSLFQNTLGTDRGEKVVGKLDGSGYVVRSRNLTDTEVRSLESVLSSGSIDKISTIGATVGTVFKKRAFWAVTIAVVAIILFVAFAFRKVPEGLSSWKFGMAAIVALVHDITIIIGLFAVLGYFFGIEVDTLFITALLTVLGFSVNDTIVIFDRVRENLKGQKSRKHFAELAEKALWQSMRRSINTSLSTLLVIGTMLFFFTGFPDLFFFFLALSVGIIIGTYSSLFVATPLLVSWHAKK